MLYGEHVLSGNAFHQEKRRFITIKRRCTLLGSLLELCGVCGLQLSLLELHRHPTQHNKVFQAKGMGRCYDGVSDSKLKMRALVTHGSSSRELLGPHKPLIRGKGFGGGWRASGVSGWRQDWECLPSACGTGNCSIES